VLGSLLTSKLIFSAFAGPVLSLGMALPCTQMAVAYMARKFVPQYSREMSLDQEVAGVVMLFEISLVLGFCVPWIIPLCGIALGLQVMVFRISVHKFGVKLTHEARPSARYLWASLGMGWGLLSWFYISCRLHGRWLVVIGPPLMAAVVACLTRRALPCLGARKEQHATTEVCMQENPTLAPTTSVEEACAMSVMMSHLEHDEAATGSTGTYLTTITI